jgi:signal transduction histidine kinase
LSDPPSHAHTVQFYEQQESLVDSVAKFMGAGLDAGDHVLVITTPLHLEGFLARLDRNAVAHALASNQLTILDARETLAMFMVDDAVDIDLFKTTLSRVTASVRESAPDAPIRAFGEMVDLLWADGNPNAALRLEELWDEAVADGAVKLLCAYSIERFCREADARRFQHVCDRHSHVLPTETFTRIGEPFARLREVSTLQQRAKSLETELLRRKGLEMALREALRDRTRVEAELRESLRRERDARELAEENDLFKEQFLSALGHDLRNPLNTILTTARLMLLRGEVAGETERRIDRIVGSGIRMERMIEQILDVTRERLSRGIPIRRSAPQDIVPIVTRIVEEVRESHPDKNVTLETDGACIAAFDAARLEQVLRTVVRNAVMHGARNAAVSVFATGEVVTVEVRNDGEPIDADLGTVLLDPFKRLRKPAGRSEGLGLGLYIAKRILEAHAGSIELESTTENGTCVRVTLPREP